MATTSIMPLHTGKGRTVGRAISGILDYVENPEKTDNGRLITGYECDTRLADAEFLLSKRQYAAITGRERGANDVIAYHVRQAFVPGEVTPEDANRIGVEFARRFTKGKHAFIVCTHIDRAHVHNHIIWNSTSLDCTRKFRNFWNSTKAVRLLSDTLCIENGLSVVENSQRRGKRYNQWLGDAAKPTHRENLRAAIDAARTQKPADFDALLSLLQAAGYEIKRGKVPSLRGSDQKRFIRMDTLGEGYSPEDLSAALSGGRAHRPCEKPVNLLVDIQAKLREGKGVGYERWAKVFNLKQMAQTFNYLTEHGLLEYAALAEKTASATEKCNELSAQIKAADARLAELSALRTHIINYSKTRDVYVGYRKAGYSKKYLTEHEGDILLHKAAKAAFDELGLKNLPTVKSLQAEYAAVLAEKKATYPEYRKARDEMKELLVVKANVDRILDTDEREAPREKEHEQH